MDHCIALALKENQYAILIVMYAVITEGTMQYAVCSYTLGHIVGLPIRLAAIKTLMGTSPVIHLAVDWSDMVCIMIVLEIEPKKASQPLARPTSYKTIDGGQVFELEDTKEDEQGQQARRILFRRIRAPLLPNGFYGAM